MLRDGFEVRSESGYNLSYASTLLGGGNSP